MRALKNFEKNLLESGNTYSFAHLVLELHEDICKEAEFTFDDAVNRYKARTDYADGTYILWGNNGVKYFFDTEMNFRGAKF